MVGVIGDDIAFQAGGEGFAQFGFGIEPEKGGGGGDKDEAREATFGGGDAGIEGGIGRGRGGCRW